MPTQEERLAAVEKFTQQAAAHIRETEENTTILLGVIRSQGQDIKRLVAQGEQHGEMLKAIETAIQLLSGNIMNMRTELLVIKALVAKEEE